MDIEKIRETVKEIIIEKLGENEINDDTRFIEDLIADSLDLAELMISVEIKFNIEVPKEDLNKISTFKDLVEYIDKKIN